MSGYRSGFCQIGCHEGAKTYSHSGKPMKACTLIETCTCSCHAKITRMYATTGVARIARQNPEYVQAPNVDLSWLEELRAGTSEDTPVLVRHVPEVPDPVAPGLAQSARSFAPNAVGGRAKGQLEDEVRRVCNRYSSGEIDTLMTPKVIGLNINKDSPPSAGAIGAVLFRWEKIGFARIKRQPIRFVGYTVPGMRMGLEKMKANAKKAGV